MLKLFVDPYIANILATPSANPSGCGDGFKVGQKQLMGPSSHPAAVQSYVQNLGPGWGPCDDHPANSLTFCQQNQQQPLQRAASMTPSGADHFHQVCERVTGTILLYLRTCSKNLSYLMNRVEREMNVFSTAWL